MHPFFSSLERLLDKGYPAFDWILERWTHLTVDIFGQDKGAILALPLVAAFVVIAIHAYLGMHVIARKVIFVDIALAQIAAVGAMVAINQGWDPESTDTYIHVHILLYSLGFAALAAAVFAITRTKEEHVPQEAIIGLTYAIASAAAILLAARSPHGTEHLNQLIAGNVLFATRYQAYYAAVVYLLVGIFHLAFGRRFLLISQRPTEAYEKGLRVRTWDFLFYLSFAVVITLSVQIVGVLLVFCYLVAPSVFGALFSDRFWPRLIIGWGISIAVTVIALDTGYKYPSSPAVMCVFGAALVLGGVVRGIQGSRDRLLASAITLVSGAALFGVGWTVDHYDVPPAEAHEEDAEAPHGGHSAEHPAPEHPIAKDISALRDALKDPHDPGVRAKAAEELGKGKDLSVVTDLAMALSDKDDGVKEKAAAAIEALNGTAAVPELAKQIKKAQDDDWVRFRMAHALVVLGSADGIPCLLELAKDSDVGKIREQALDSLLIVMGRDRRKEMLADAEGWWKKNQGQLDYDKARKAFVPNK